MKVNQQQVQSLIQNDPGLPPDRKQELLAKISDPDVFDEIMNGVLGAGIGYVVAKFLNLSKRTQILLSMAGFGVGSYLEDKTRHSDKKFVNYNPKLKAYELKQ